MREPNDPNMAGPETLRHFCSESFSLQINSNQDVPCLLPKLLYTKDEAAMIFGVTVSTINGLLRKGLLPHHRIGKHVRFTLQDLLEYLEKSKVEI